MPDSNLHPTFAAILEQHGLNDGSRAVAALSPNIPAHADFIWRRQLAAGAARGRQSVVEACKAELDWAIARCPANVHKDEWGLHILASEPPHVQAAARLLNCWGHVHPKEWRLRAAMTRLRVQRQAGWHDRAGATCADIREIWKDRRNSLGAFWAAAREYQRLRAEVV